MNSKKDLSAIEELINFLRTHPESSKYLSSILNNDKELQEKLKESVIFEDIFIKQIYQILQEQFVISELELIELLNLKSSEIRGRLNSLELELKKYIIIDRLDDKNWIVYISEEGLKNV